MGLRDGPLIWFAERDESDALWVSTNEDGFDEAMIADRYRLPHDGLVTDGAYFVVVELPSGYFNFGLSFDFYERDFPELPFADGMSVAASEVTIDLQGRHEIWLAGAMVAAVNGASGFSPVVEVEPGTRFARLRVVAVGRDQERAEPPYEAGPVPRAWYSIQVMPKAFAEPATTLARDSYRGYRNQ